MQMAKGAYKHGIDRLTGKETFTVTKSSISSDVQLYGVHTFRKCTVRFEAPKKNVKPHALITSAEGDLILDIGATQYTAYSILRGVDGRTLPRMTVEDNGDWYRVSFTAPKRSATVTGARIERIILDTETTGLIPQYDEILQLAIIDGEGNILLNHYYKPQYQEEWPESERIHHISPTMVKDKNTIESDLPVIQDLFDRAKEVVVYNAEYDLAFLGELGIKLSWSKVIDTMREYGRQYHKTDYYKLEKAARECGYTYHAHDALADIQATLVVQNKVDGRTTDLNKFKTDRQLLNEARAMKIWHIFCICLLSFFILVFSIALLIPLVIICALLLVLSIRGLIKRNKQITELHLKAQ